MHHAVDCVRFQIIYFVQVAFRVGTSMLGSAPRGGAEPSTAALTRDVALITDAMNLLAHAMLLQYLLAADICLQ